LKDAEVLQNVRPLPVTTPANTPRPRRE